MTIPPFDAHGNIPVPGLFGGSQAGTITVALAEMHRALVASIPVSSTRTSIWDGWMRLRTAIEAFPVNYAFLAGGSFVTHKENPSDLDCCLFLNAHEVNALGPADQAAISQLFATSHCKATFKCDLYAVPIVPVGNPWFEAMTSSVSYWTRVFGWDRSGLAKSCLLITERGTL